MRVGKASEEDHWSGGAGRADGLFDMVGTWHTYTCGETQTRTHTNTHTNTHASTHTNTHAYMTHIGRLRPVRCLVLVCLQCVAVCCSVLQCVAVCCSVLQCVLVYCRVFQCSAECRSVLQRVAVCCIIL